MKDKVLVVDDDKEIVNSIDIYLRNENIEILKAYDGLEALKIVDKEEVHLILMDIMMPNMDGMRATLKIRESKNIPIIMLSAKSEDTDKVIGLNVGADDYVTKPFNPLELIARVKSQLRRYKLLGSMEEKKINEIEVRGLYLNKDNKQVIVNGDEVKVTPIEFKILELLMSNLNRVFKAEEIYERVWDEPCYNSETVMVHIRRIREKIEINPKEPIYLKVVWGSGYKIEK
ncbi:MAG: response regulator transcription factor [Clostridium sp.]